MIILGLVLISLTLFFCFSILIPWYRKSHQLQLNQSLQVNLYQEKLHELTADLNAGNIDAESYEAAKDDLKLQLASELANIQSHSSIKFKRGYVWLLPIITLVLVCVIYFGQGKPEQMQQFYQAEQQTSEFAKKLLSGNENFSKDELTSFYIGLRNKLASESDDATGWLLLGRVAYSLGHLENSMQAYERSLELSPNKYSTLLSYAQVLISTNDDKYREKALDAYNQILKQAPQDAEALTMAGYVAFQLDRKDAARVYWRSALQTLDEKDNRIQAIAQAMPDLAQELGIALPKLATQTPTSSQKQTETDGVSKKIKVNLLVSESTHAKLAQFKYLVVFARPQLSGPPAAVVRLPISGELPKQLTLSDENAMMANFNLSSLSQAYVTVRLSKDADVALADNDVEVNSAQLTLDDLIHTVTIEL
ncbi:c-type cytochrome biogenesis protein CcmI [Catenovulum adriaticum]|uniref:C-type cytochrome biogenesis protein CcmI n=1 Tax=Catenovulum adriaticum TaxID=2984846 RepID=A0ABY7AI17_9ALTE|nr:c-type cytochrome biogenesis protein CcmI [Catenovulum sp. TS8]WAJ69253.1 c-type cytochrome biogenesis protein CcmI [Catenovulum sp. TS8]